MCLRPSRRVNEGMRAHGREMEGWRSLWTGRPSEFFKLKARGSCDFLDSAAFPWHSAADRLLSPSWWEREACLGAERGGGHAGGGPGATEACTLNSSG